MIDIISNELLGQIKLPMKLVDRIKIEDVTQLAGKFLHSKQTVELSSDEIKELGNPVLIKSVEGISATSGYGISEYFGAIDTYVANEEYYSHAMNTGTSMYVNVYDIMKSKSMPAAITDKLVKFDPLEIDPGRNLFSNRPIIGYDTTYITYSESKYYPDLKISGYDGNVHALAVNLPYDYYSKQIIPSNIFTWDVAKKIYQILNYDSITTRVTFENICQYGFKNPLCMQIRNGRIVSATDEAYLAILIATFIKLPTIPVILYMLDHDHIITRPIDAIYPKLDPGQISMDEHITINNVCNPYFKFYDPEYDNHELADFHLVPDEGAAVDEITSITAGSTTPTPSLSEEEIREIHNKNLQDTMDQIDRDIKNAIKEMDTMFK